MIRDQWKVITTWEERHRRLIGRLIIVLLATVAIDAFGTVLIYLTERNAQKGDIHNLFDAFFFTTVQLLTVSSQIRNPLTTLGRIVDIFLEVWAVIVVAGSAGAIASFFQSADP
jgi:Ion channel